MCRNIIKQPIDGILDLHTFKPKDVKELIKDYLEECIKNKIFHLRIIHGKGKGILQRIVHSQLSKSELVESYSLGDINSGGWGSTIVKLKDQDSHFAITGNPNEKLKSKLNI